MTKLTPTQQAIASNMGQEKLESDNLVTLVRRKFVLEEIVITREEYENYNKRVKDDFYWSELNFENAEWEDLEEENTYYSAYEGDVTSFTDDIVTFMQPDPKQRWAGEPLPLLNSDDFYDQFNE
tara:strand:+ start:2456 stop:2827 length:372 start_codon:yes stop_codon:yes gene_type:complete